MKSGFARNLFQKADVAPDIIGGQIGDGADARGFYPFQFLDCPGGKLAAAAPFFRPSLQNIGRIGNVFVRQGETELRRIQRSQNRLNCSFCRRGF